MQSASMAKAKTAVDDEPAVVRWRSTASFLDEVVKLYGAGLSVNQIGLKLGIAWDSVAKLLDRAGVRERKQR